MHKKIKDGKGAYPGQKKEKEGKRGEGRDGGMSTGNGGSNR